MCLFPFLHVLNIYRHPNKRTIYGHLPRETNKIQLYNTIPLGIILSLLMPAPNNVHFYDIVTIAKYSSHLGLVVHRLSHVGEKSRIVC